MLELILAWRNIWRHARRTWLTIAAMVFSNVLLVFMISVQFATYQMMIDGSLKAFVGHIQLQTPGYLDEPAIRKAVPDIVSVAQSVRDNTTGTSVGARAMGFALASSEERSYGVQVVGVEPEREPAISSIPGLIGEGYYLNEDDPGGVVVGSVLARNLKISLGDELTLLGTGRDGSFAADVLTVVGIFESGMNELDRSMVQMHLPRFQDTFFMQGGGHSVVVNYQDFEAVAAGYRQLQNRFAGRDDIVVLDWNAMQPGLRQAIQSDMASSWMMYAVLIVLVAFGVLNTQLMSVLERTREFGIVMALGLRARRMVRLIFLETALMAGVGLLGGILLGGILTAVLAHTGFTYPGMEEMADRFNLPARIYPQLSPLSAVLGPGVVFIVSLLAATYPALRLFRLQPVAAMRAV